jgi:hypothetical protein
MIHNPGIIRIYTIIVPTNAHKCIEIIFFYKMGWFCYFTIAFYFIFFMYLTFIFYKLEDGNTVGQNMQEFIVSIN